MNNNFKRVSVCTFFIFCTITAISGCKQLSEPEYSKTITSCIESAIKKNLTTGTGIQFTENYFKTCIDKQLVGKDISDTLFKVKELKALLANSSEKPIFLQVFSPLDDQCRRELKYLNKVVEQYKDVVQFIILVEMLPEHSLIGSKMSTKTWTEELEYPSFNSNIKTLYFNKESRNYSEERYGALISGVRSVGYPTTYFISKDKSLFALTTADDLVLDSNKILMNDMGLSNAALSKKSFYNRVPKLIESFVEANK